MRGCFIPYEGEAEEYSHAAMCKAIHDAFMHEYGHEVRFYKTYQETFFQWQCGLPTIFDASCVYSGDAKRILGDLLEETEEERNRFTETEAERCLSGLMYMEILRNI